MAARNANNLVKNALFALLILSFFAAPALAQWDFSGRIGYATERGSFSLIFGQQPDETANVFVRFFSQRVPLLINIRTFQYTTRQAGAPLWAMLLVFAAVFSLVYVLVKKVPMFKDSGNGRENKAPLVIFCLALSLMCVFLTPIPFIFLTFLAWIGAITGFGAGAVIFFSVCVTLLVWFLGSLGQAHKGVSDFKRGWRANRVEPKKRPRRDDGDDGLWGGNHGNGGGPDGDDDEPFDDIKDDINDRRKLGINSRLERNLSERSENVARELREEIKSSVKEVHELKSELSNIVKLFESYKKQTEEERKKTFEEIEKKSESSLKDIKEFINSFSSKEHHKKVYEEIIEEISKKVDYKNTVETVTKARLDEMFNKISNYESTIREEHRKFLESIKRELLEKHNFISARVQDEKNLIGKLEELIDEMRKQKNAAQSDNTSIQQVVQILQHAANGDVSGLGDLKHLIEKIGFVEHNLLAELRLIFDGMKTSHDLKKIETTLSAIELSFSGLLNKVGELETKIGKKVNTQSQSQMVNVNVRGGGNNGGKGNSGTNTNPPNRQTTDDNYLKVVVEPTSQGREHIFSLNKPVYDKLKNEIPQRWARYTIKPHNEQQDFAFEIKLDSGKGTRGMYYVYSIALMFRDSDGKVKVFTKGMYNKWLRKNMPLGNLTLNKYGNTEEVGYIPGAEFSRKKNNLLVVRLPNSSKAAKTVHVCIYPQKDARQVLLRLNAWLVKKIDVTNSEGKNQKAFQYFCQATGGYEITNNF